MTTIAIADRVKETTTTTGTGSYTLAGAATGYRTFNAGIGTSSVCEYCCTNGTDWEIGQGALSASTTLDRTVILASSNAGAAVSWAAGSKDIFITAAANGLQNMRWNLNDAVAAAGSTQGTATALAATINSVATASAGQGVILPSAKVGAFITVSNHSTVTVKVYPATGETVEGLAANAPLSLLPGQCYRAAVATAGAWVGVDLNPWHDETNSFTMPIVSANPSAPEADTMLFYARKICGRVLPKWMPPSGVDNPVQPALFGNNVVLYMPNTGTTAGLNLGTPWAVGTTVSHPTPSSTAPAMLNQMKRTRSANVVTTTNQILGVSSIVTGAHQFWRGNSAGLGGFFFFARFSIELWAASTCRLFVGLHSGTTAMVASDAVPAISLCGVWHDTTMAGTVLNFVTKDGTTLSSTAITLTGALAAGQLFDLYMYCAPNGSTMYYRMDDVIAGTTLVDSSTATNLPAATTFMGPSVTMSNGTANITATTVAIGVNRIYVESDH